MNDRRWIRDALEAGFLCWFYIRIWMVQKYALDKWVSDKPVVNVEWLAIKSCVIYKLT